MYDIDTSSYVYNGNLVVLVHWLSLSCVAMSVCACMQDGRLNCLQCAARYRRTELFHHLVQKYGWDPKEKDNHNGVRNCACMHVYSMCVRVRMCGWK